LYLLPRSASGGLSNHTSRRRAEGVDDAPSLDRQRLAGLLLTNTPIHPQARWRTRTSRARARSCWQAIEPARGTKTRWRRSLPAPFPARCRRSLAIGLSMAMTIAAVAEDHRRLGPPEWDSCGGCARPPEFAAWSSASVTLCWHRLTPRGVDAAAAKQRHIDSSCRLGTVSGTSTPLGRPLIVSAPWPGAICTKPVRHRPSRRARQQADIES